jgi:hypothetical protein
LTGLAKANKEGTTNIKISEVVELTSITISTKIEHIKLDTSTIPSQITNIENHEDYSECYRIQFFLWTADYKYDITPSSEKSLINHNIQFKCKTNDIKWIFAKSLQVFYTFILVIHLG